MVDLDAKRGKAFGGGARALLTHRLQEAGRSVDEVDLELVRLHVGVVLRQDIALHLCQCPCDLNSRRTATDDRYREEGFAGLGLV